jgi:hypothetical protein
LLIQLYTRHLLIQIYSLTDSSLTPLCPLSASLCTTALTNPNRKALLGSLVPAANALLILSLIWLLYGILGMNLFGGRFYRCNDEEGIVALKVGGIIGAGVIGAVLWVELLVLCCGWSYWCWCCWCCVVGGVIGAVLGVELLVLVLLVMCCGWCYWRCVVGGVIGAVLWVEFIGAVLWVELLVLVLLVLCCGWCYWRCGVVMRCVLL